jgi:hypothetical protein
MRLMEVNSCAMVFTISAAKHLEAKQEGATDADLVDLGILIRYPL